MGGAPEGAQASRLTRTAAGRCHVGQRQQRPGQSSSPVWDGPAAVISVLGGMEACFRAGWQRQWGSGLTRSAGEPYVQRCGREAAATQAGLPTGGGASMPGLADLYVTGQLRLVARSCMLWSQQRTADGALSSSPGAGACWPAGFGSVGAVVLISSLKAPVGRHSMALASALP